MKKLSITLILAGLGINMVHADPLASVAGTLAIDASVINTMLNSEGAVHWTRLLESLDFDTSLRRAAVQVKHVVAGIRAEEVEPVSGSLGDVANSLAVNAFLVNAYLQASGDDSILTDLGLGEILENAAVTVSTIRAALQSDVTDADVEAVLAGV